MVKHNRGCTVCARGPNSFLSTSDVMQNKNGCGNLLVDSCEIEMSHGGRQG